MSPRQRVRLRAERQFGRVGHFQLRAMGIAQGQIRRWLLNGFLLEVLPAVYALAQHAGPDGADYIAAVLYAGPGAMLSHDTAAVWRGYIDWPVGAIQVSTPRCCVSRPGRVIVHERRPRPRWLCRGVPVTGPEQTVLDLAAASGNPTLVRKALARMDYMGVLDLGQVDVICGKGRPGSRLVHWAVRNYDPRFGQTNSPFEDDYLVFCEALGVPKPDLVNEDVDGVNVDAYYVDAELVIELDGRRNHASDPHLLRDHGNDMHFRSRGKTVLRYTWNLVNHRPQAVKADVLAALARGRAAHRRPTRA